MMMRLRPLPKRDCQSFSAPHSSQVVNVLRSQLAQLEEMKKERESLEGEIKAVTFDMSTSFLTALAQDGAINEEQLSLSQLDQLYGSHNQRVQASLRTQEELLGQVQVHKLCPVEQLKPGGVVGFITVLREAFQSKNCFYRLET